jgi:hypothetical protein
MNVGCVFPVGPIECSRVESRFLWNMSAGSVRSLAVLSCKFSVSKKGICPNKQLYVDPGRSPSAAPLESISLFRPSANGSKMQAWPVMTSSTGRGWNSWENSFGSRSVCPRDTRSNFWISFFSRLTLHALRETV